MRTRLFAPVHLAPAKDCSPSCRRRGRPLSSPLLPSLLLSLSIALVVALSSSPLLLLPGVAASAPEQIFVPGSTQSPASVAYDVYCKCPPAVAHSSSLCASIIQQCRASLCAPICTRMAWQPRITVDCARAPQWKWCPTFAAQVREAATAITAQFQAHTCLQLGFCNRTAELVDWVENHSFGKHYPEHRLPVKTCTLADALPAAASTGASAASTGASAAAATAAVGPGAVTRAREQLCGACEAVVDVELVRGACTPGNVQTAEVLQTGSFRDRCLYLSDVIGARATPLLTELRARVCPCLGCCGGSADAGSGGGAAAAAAAATCFFPNVERQWLDSLVSSVQRRVAAELRQEGWHLEL